MGKKMIAWLCIVGLLTVAVVGCTKTPEKQASSQEVVVEEPKSTEPVIPVDNEPGEEEKPSTPNPTPTDPPKQEKPSPTSPPSPPPTNEPKAPSSPKPTTPVVTLGATVQDALKVLGPHRKVVDGHGLSKMYFGASLFPDVVLHVKSLTYTEHGDPMGTIIGWDNPKKDSRLSIGPRVEGAAPFTLGSSLEDVAKVFDTPIYVGDYTTGISEHRLIKLHNWSYVVFDEDWKVTAWNNAGELKVSLGIKKMSAPPFTIGSTRQDVINAMGTPTAIEIFSPEWRYGEDVIKFTEDMSSVRGWFNTYGTLNVSVGTKDPNAPIIRLGSTMAEVAAAMGTPTAVFSPHEWKYGKSYVVFSTVNNKVSRLSNYDKNLKISTTQYDPNALGFTIGSSQDEVIAAMGVPERIEPHTGTLYAWFYGAYYVRFGEDGKVTDWHPNGSFKTR